MRRRRRPGTLLCLKLVFGCESKIVGLPHGNAIVSGHIGADCRADDPSVLRQIEDEIHPLIRPAYLVHSPYALPPRRRVGRETQSRLCAILFDYFQLHVHLVNPGHCAKVRRIALYAHKDLIRSLHLIGLRTADKAPLFGSHIHLVLIEKGSPQSQDITYPVVIMSSIGQDRAEVFARIEGGKALQSPASQQQSKSLTGRFPIDPHSLPARGTQSQGREAGADIITGNNGKIPAAIAVGSHHQFAEIFEEEILPHQTAPLQTHAVRTGFAPADERVSPQQMRAQAIV